jgi:hypothetical protein
MRYFLPVQDPRGSYGLISSWLHLKCSRRTLKQLEVDSPAKEAWGWAGLEEGQQVIYKGVFIYCMHGEWMRIISFISCY